MPLCPTASLSTPRPHPTAPPRPPLERPDWRCRAYQGVVERAIGWPPTAHSGRVACLAGAVAHDLGLAPARVREAYLAGLLHDSGKLLISGRVRRKVGALDPHEWRQMQRHPVYSAGLSRLVPGLPFTVWQAVRHHHERLDGSGYPGGLAGDAVPLLARILAACDVYDALSSPRAYKDAWTSGAVWDELTAQSGRHFDPEVLAALRRCVPEGTALQA
ncbi:HD domain-containing protein [Deinococcus sp. SDU3-2]|uniref:HD domain-containing protein n=1 Tax=Deinococcus terrestris TaxID=2651870 RepID=A0A7X1TRP9_9DEIO|nr:HD domain-containing phosphohydrolase [Deinococcus terrestris]MPY66567.1 HD domain-containing protein [Deinococcus terrestris]